jgi:hypothetical protein
MWIWSDHVDRPCLSMYAPSHSIHVLGSDPSAPCLDAPPPSNDLLHNHHQTQKKKKQLFIGPPEKNPYTGKMLRPSVDYPFVENVGLDTKQLKRWVIKSVPSHVVKATAEVRDGLGVVDRAVRLDLSVAAHNPVTDTSDTQILDQQQHSTKKDQPLLRRNVSCLCLPPPTNHQPSHSHSRHHHHRTGPTCSRPPSRRRARAWCSR